MAVLDFLGVAVLLDAVFLGGVALRRLLLSRRGGTVDVSVRLRARRQGYGWALGVARYDGDSLLWYRLFSLSPRPRRAVARHGLSVVVRRSPTGTEALSLLAGSVVVECRTTDGPVELAMSEAAYPGFLSWLEATPALGSDLL